MAGVAGRARVVPGGWMPQAVLPETYEEPPAPYHKRATDEGGHRQYGAQRYMAHRLYHDGRQGDVFPRELDGRKISVDEWDDLSFGNA